MDFATLVINVAVPVGTVLLALIVYAPLSAVFWRQFLKLSVPGRARTEIATSDGTLTTADTHLPRSPHPTPAATANAKALGLTIRGKLTLADEVKSPEGWKRFVTKVLYVEHNDDNIYMLKTRLELLGGFEVLAAGDSESGCELAVTEHPDVILMDL